MGTIKPDQLGNAIAEALKAFEGVTEDAMLKGINETAQEAAAVVRSKAQHFGSNYAGDITARKAQLIRRNGAANASAYVTAGDHYRVAHLLEHGHAVVRGGRIVGQAKGFEHFADGERYAEDHIVENIRKGIE